MYRFNGIVAESGAFDLEEVGDSIQILDMNTEEVLGIIQGASLNEFVHDGEDEPEIDYKGLAEAIDRTLRAE